MMAVSKEHLERYELEHRSKHPELATYARLEWGGHTGWLLSIARRRDHRPPRAVRLGGWARRLRLPRQEAPVAQAPFLVERVRIHEGLEILISVEIPNMPAAVALEMPRDDEEPVAPDLTFAP